MSAVKRRVSASCDRDAHTAHLTCMLSLYPFYILYPLRLHITVSFFRHVCFAIKLPCTGQVVGLKAVIRPLLSRRPLTTQRVAICWESGLDLLR